MYRSLVCALVVLLLGCSRGFGPDSTFSLSSSFEVDGRQGVAADEEYLYVSSSTVLYKYSKDGTLIARNDDPFSSLSLPANHFGDIDVYDGHIYTGIETFVDGVGENIQVAVYDASTLQYEYSIPWRADSGQVEVCGLAVDGEGKRVWMADWVQGHELYCYDLESREYIGKTTLSPSPRQQQGICFRNGYIVISADDGDADLREHDNLWICRPEIGGTVECRKWRIMDDFAMDGEIEGLTFDPVSGALIVLSNRGSRIVKGMVRGFYDGYDREIHDVYVYMPDKR